jgi:hypothetical protein
MKIWLSSVGTGSFRFGVFYLCLSRGVVCIKDYNIKASTGFNYPAEALVSAPSENIKSLVPPEG